MNLKFIVSIAMCLLPLNCGGDDAQTAGDAGAADASPFERAQEPAGMMRVAGDGVITLAGSSEPNLVDGPREVARFHNPTNVVLGPDGNLYVADNDNSCVRIVRPSGEVLTYTRQEGFAQPFGMAFAPDGTLYVQTDANDRGERTEETGTLWRVDRATGRATVIARDLGRPRGLAVLPDGRLVMSDNEHHFLRVYDPTTNAISPFAGVHDLPGYYDADGTGARFNHPYDIVVQGDHIVVADQGNHRLRAVTFDGRVTTLAGSGEVGSVDGPAMEARFNLPQGLSVDGRGNVYVSDIGAYVVRRLAPDGAVTTVVGAGASGFVDGDLRQARFVGLEGIDISADGETMFIADGNRGGTDPSHRVRRVMMPTPSL